MKVKITYHGRLAELLKKETEVLEIAATTADEMREDLGGLYPSLKESTFQIAQHNKIVTGSDELTNEPIDIFPPFSGG